MNAFALSVADKNTRYIFRVIIWNIYSHFTFLLEKILKLSKNPFFDTYINNLFSLNFLTLTIHGKLSIF